MTIEITTFAWVPPFAQGHVRDYRIRWACEEAGLRYAVKTLDFKEAKGAEYRRRQPFGQVPVYRDDVVELFESGSAVLRVGERSEALLPADPASRARATMWLIAALNSVEPAVMALVVTDQFRKDEATAQADRPYVLKLLEARLTSLQHALGDREWLEGRFTAGDLMMVSVLRNLQGMDVLGRFPRLDAYVARGEARPAFERAIEAQRALYRQRSPAPASN